MRSFPEVMFFSPRLQAERVRAGDEERLQSVFGAAGDYFIPVTGEPRPDPDAAIREIRSCAEVAGREAVVLVVREDERDVGAIGWWEGVPEPDVALLGMLLVSSGERGRGYAREAMQALEELLSKRQIRRLRTGVGAHDAEKHALLLALGFSPLDERTHVSLDRGRMMLALFEKTLAGVSSAG